MDIENPIKSLFPDKNNLEITSPIETAPKDSEDLESVGDSINTNVLWEIIGQEAGGSNVSLTEKLKNSRFYLSDRYAHKVHNDNNQLHHIMTSGAMTSGHESASHGIELDDFQIYNDKVEREFALREKLNKLLQDKQSRGVQILSSDTLLKNYVGGTEDENKSMKPLKIRQKFSGLLKGICTHENHMSESYTFQDATSGQVVSSNDTHIIDLEKNVELAIDENVDENIEQPYSVFEYKLSSSSNNTGRTTSPIMCEYQKIKKTLASKLPQPGHNDVYHVQRKLHVRHLQMIAIGASLGVGLFLTSGKAFTVAGPFGTLLGFLLCASIVLATMLSFTEISTLIPISSGFSGLASRFVEDAFGFALGWSYWFSFVIALPNQIVASTFMLSYYEHLNVPSGSTAGFVTLFLFFAIFVNLLDVRILGEILYGSTFFKILITVMMMIAMIALNAGAGAHRHSRVGFRYWDSSKSPEGLTYGLFRPTFDLGDKGSGSLDGIGGSKGRFLAVLVVMLISSFAFSGVELAFVASGEAVNPRKTLPSATKRTFIIIIILYLFSIFLVGLNIYSGDPRLLRYYASPGKDVTIDDYGTKWQVETSCNKNLVVNLDGAINGSQSPWVLALQSFGLCTFSSVFNGILIFFGPSAGCSSLYASSRTLYSMSIQGKAPELFRRCSKKGIPYVSVLFCGAFGVTSYLSVSKESVENFQALANISSASICIIWMGLNISFLRFYYALKKRPDIISRDDPSFPYRSPFQPYLAFYGLLGSTILVLFMGFTTFLHGLWNTKVFFSAYGGLMFFTVCYLGYKTFGTSKIQRLDQLDMDSGRREIDRMIWDEHHEYSDTFKERAIRWITWLF